MKSRICTIAAVSFCLISLWWPACADTVYLKNGKILEVETTRLEGDQVCFVFKGIEASIPQSKVVRVEKSAGQMLASQVPAKRGHGSGNGSPSENAGKPAPNQIEPPDEAEAGPRQQPLSTPKPLVLQKDGLKDLKWGSRLSHLPGMKYKPTDSGLKDVVEYVRPKELLKLGDIDLTAVVYAFWRDQLYTISIWTEGQNNFNALRNAAFAQFGRGARIDSSMERYLWSTDTTDVMLKYAGEGQCGLLWLRGKDLDRKMKLSKLNRHTSFLKRMESLR